MAEYKNAALNYNARLAAGQSLAPRPAEPGPFADPGASLRAEAQQLLTGARAARDAAAVSAAATIGSATDRAPAEPSFWSQLGGDISDGLQVEQLGQVHLAGGIASGAADIVRFARSIDPADPWNEDHPAEFAAGLSGTAAGLVTDALSPQEAARSILGSGWGSDPFDAAGRLIPNGALAAGTDGAGTIADTGESAAERAALRVGGTATGLPAATAEGAADTAPDIGSLLKGDSSGAGPRLPMSQSVVNDVAGKYGLDLRGGTVKINKSLAGVAGSTASDGTITSYRGAFTGEEQLARTLAHELYHASQIPVMGYPQTYDAYNAWEIEARAYEDSWWANHPLNR